MWFDNKSVNDNTTYSIVINTTHNLLNDSSNIPTNGNFTGTITLGIVFGIIIFLTVAGNTLVLLSVALTRNLRKPTNYLVVNLALADLSLGLSVLPFSATVQLFNGHWPFGQTFCVVWAAVDVLYCTASINTLCAISIDRYFGVVNPLRYREIINGRRVFLMIVVVWVVSICVSLPPILGWREPQDPNYCKVNSQIGYVFFSVSGSFYIPTIIVLIVYGRIYKITRSSIGEMMQNMVFPEHTDNEISSDAKQNSKMESKFSGSESSLTSSSSSSSGIRSGVYTVNATRDDVITQRRIRKFKMELKAAKTLAKVVGAFVLCWFPFFFILPLDAVCDCVPILVADMAFWLGYCNSLVNPFVYAYSSKSFRDAFLRILTCGSIRRK